MTLATALQDALAAVARLVAVAQLDRLVRAGRGARRHGRPADRAVVEDDVDLDRRVAARIEDLARVDDSMSGAHASSAPSPLGSVRSMQARSTPGSSRPSRNSSDAPPPVEMWVIRSARPCCSTAATESPPPTTTVAPASARSARNRATALVPWANDGISKTPSGPFQKTVFDVGERLDHEVLAVLADVDDVPRGRDLLGRSVLYSVPRVTSLATTTSTGRTTRTPFFAAADEDPPRVLDAVGLGEALADRLALGEQERVGHAAAEDEHVDLREQVVDDLDLVRDLGAAEDRGERPRRAPRAACESISISRSIRSPA